MTNVFTSLKPDNIISIIAHLTLSEIFCFRIINKKMLLLYQTDMLQFLKQFLKRENEYFQLKLMRYLPSCQDIRIDLTFLGNIQYSVLSDQRYDAYQSKTIMHCSEPLCSDALEERDVLTFGPLTPFKNSHSQWPGEMWNNVSFAMKTIYAHMLKDKETLGSVMIADQHDLLQYRNKFLSTPDQYGQYFTITDNILCGTPTTTYVIDEAPQNIPFLNQHRTNLLRHGARRFNISTPNSSINFQIDKFDHKWQVHRYRPFLNEKGHTARYTTFKRRFPNHIIEGSTYVGDGFEFIGIPELNLSVGAILRCGYELCEPKIKLNGNYTTDEKVVEQLISGLDGFFISTKKKHQNYRAECWNFDQNSQGLCEAIAGEAWKDFRLSQLGMSLRDKINLVLPNGPTFVTRRSGRRVTFAVSYFDSNLVILSLDMYVENRDHFYFIVTRKYKVLKNDNYDKKLAIHPHNGNRPPYDFDLIGVKVDTIGKWFHNYPTGKKRTMDEIYDRLPYGIAYVKEGKIDYAIVNIGSTTAKVKLENGKHNIFGKNNFLYYSTIKGNSAVPHKYFGTTFSGEQDGSFLSNHPIIIQLKNGEACFIQRCQAPEFSYQLAHHQITFTIFAKGLKRKKQYFPTKNSFLNKHDEFMKVWKIQYAGLAKGKHKFFLFHTRLHMMVKRSIPDYVATVYV